MLAEYPQIAEWLQISAEPRNDLLNLSDDESLNSDESSMSSSDDSSSSYAKLIAEKVTFHDLKRLRLVNKQLAKAATPMLFNFIDATWTAFDREGPLRWSERLKDISQSSIAQHIRNLAVGWRSQSESASDIPDSCVDEDMVRQVGAKIRSGNSLPIWIQPLEDLCTNLKTLRVIGHYEDYDEPPLDEFLFLCLDQIFKRFETKGAKAHLPMIELDLRTGYLRHSSKFTSSSTSALPWMRNVSTLQITAPEDEDFEEMDIYNERVHILRVGLDLTMKHTVSLVFHGGYNVLQKARPDSVHTGNIRNLSLSELTISTELLIEMCHGDQKTLESLSLQKVIVDSDNWVGSLIALCELSKLQYFGLHNCRYKCNRYLLLRQAADRDHAIQSYDFHKYIGLREVQKHVNGVRVRMGKQRHLTMGFINTLDDNEEIVELTYDWCESGAPLSDYESHLS